MLNLQCATLLISRHRALALRNQQGKKSWFSLGHPTAFHNPADVRKIVVTSDARKFGVSAHAPSYK
jgi:hypothetical protein